MIESKTKPRLAAVERRNMRGWLEIHKLEGDYSPEDLARLNEACKPNWRITRR